MRVRDYKPWCHDVYFIELVYEPYKNKRYPFAIQLKGEDDKPLIHHHIARPKTYREADNRARELRDEVQLAVGRNCLIIDGIAAVFD